MNNTFSYPRDTFVQGTPPPFTPFFLRRAILWPKVGVDFVYFPLNYDIALWNSTKWFSNIFERKKKQKKCCYFCLTHELSKYRNSNQNAQSAILNLLWDSSANCWPWRKPHPILVPFEATIIVKGTFIRKNLPSNEHPLSDRIFWSDPWSDRDFGGY